MLLQAARRAKVIDGVNVDSLGGSNPSSAINIIDLSVAPAINP